MKAWQNYLVKELLQISDRLLDGLLNDPAKTAEELHSIANKLKRQARDRGR